MRTSSALQPELPGLIPQSIEEFRSTEFLTSTDSVSSMGGVLTTSTQLNAPSLNTYGSAFAATARQLGRLNSKNVKREEMDNLLNERQRLLDKKFDGTITREDENRLEYVRWSLDRIQDAQTGPSLDALESAVTAYERFMSDMRDFENQLDNAVNAQRGRNRANNRGITKRRR